VTLQPALPDTRHDIAPLTGLRFVAAMVVVLHHYPVPGVGGTLQTMLQSGYFGVTLFFVLSGFVLAINYLDAFTRSPIGALGAFAVARFARIYPVYLLILLYVWLRAGASGPIVSHALLMQAWSADASHAFALNGPGWSLSVEAFLYACFPLLILLLQRAGIFSSGRRLAAAFIIVSVVMVAIAIYFDVSGRNVAVGPHSAHRWLYRSPVFRLGDFLLGILAAGFWLRFSMRTPSRRRLGSALAILAIAAMLAFMAMPGNIDSTYSWDVLYAFPGVLLIVGLALSPASGVGRALGSPIVVLLGESSYCLYLLQVPAGVLRIADAPLTLGGQIALHGLFIGLLVALSIGVHMAVERPLQRSIRRAYARWSQRHVRISTAA
jgi:peptidoglycan/LPS O-acetylase OafA/YrhL